jgi:transcriptional regulator with XRE-family HTH domain
MARTVVVTPKPDITKPVDMPLLGAYVRHHRTRLGMTLENAAALCRVSKQAYNNIELGEKNHNVDTLFRVLNALGIMLRISHTAEAHALSEQGVDDGEWL